MYFVFNSFKVKIVFVRFWYSVIKVIWDKMSNNSIKLIVIYNKKIVFTANGFKALCIIVRVYCLAKS